MRCGSGVAGKRAARNRICGASKRRFDGKIP
jgi:hypothetical protein